MAQPTLGTVAVPGECLGSAEMFKIRSGKGAYEHQGGIYASVVGTVKDVGSQSQIEVRHILDVVHGSSASVVPAVGDLVTVKITKVTPRFADALILCVGSHTLKESFQGIIRVQDVRLTEIDKLEMSKCFRPSDIVKAKVVSLGDARSFFLSTNENELGVVYAQSVNGEFMVPFSWEEMVAPSTMQREYRKVAKRPGNDSAPASQSVS